MGNEKQSNEILVLVTREAPIQNCLSFFSLLLDMEPAFILKFQPSNKIIKIITRFIFDFQILLFSSVFQILKFPSN